MAHRVEQPAAERAGVARPLEVPRRAEGPPPRLRKPPSPGHPNTSLSMHDRLGTLAPCASSRSITGRSFGRRSSATSSRPRARARRVGDRRRAAAGRRLRRRARARRPPERRRGGRVSRGSRTSTSSCASWVADGDAAVRDLPRRADARPRVRRARGEAPRAAGRLRRGVADRRGRARPGARRPPAAGSRRSSGTATGSSCRTTAVELADLGDPAAGLPRRRARLGRAVPPGGAREQRDASGSRTTTGTALSRGRSRELERELEAKIDGWHRLGRALCLAFLAAGGPQPRRLSRRPPAGRRRRRLHARGRSAARTAAAAGRRARATAAGASSRASRPSASSRR